MNSWKARGHGLGAAARTQLRRCSLPDTGGALYWAQDRWYSGKTPEGKWKKAGRHRKDVRPMNGGQYAEYKRRNAERRNANVAAGRGYRSVVVG